MELKPKITITYELRLDLNEPEARALDGLVGYGFDAFKEHFYAKLGKAYMQPHEAGLKSLFDKISANIPGQLRIVDKAKKNIQLALSK